MSIFINADSKIIVQGMTGSEGTKVEAGEHAWAWQGDGCAIG